MISDFPQPAFAKVTSSTGQARITIAMEVATVVRPTARYHLTVSASAG